MLNEIQFISIGFFQQSLALWFQHPWLLSVTVLFPCLRQLCAQDQFAFSKVCSQGPQEMISLHPFWASFATADALSTFAQLLSLTAQ